MSTTNKILYDNNNPLFFVFTCIKDGRKYIRTLFKSLLIQSKVNFVHYIYEDGSDDPIDDYVDEYKKKVSLLDHPYKIIYEKNFVNIGLNMATKHCVDKCYLPYFIWIDCDNWVDSNFFEMLEKCVIRNKFPLLIRTHLKVLKDNILIDNKFKYFFKKNNYLYLFVNHHFYYSFFAVKKDEYLKINNNKILDEKCFFNDEQVLATCYSLKKNDVLCKKAIGYFLERFDCESKKIINTNNYSLYYKRLFNDKKFKHFINTIEELIYLNSLCKELNIYISNFNFVAARKTNKIRIRICKKYNLNTNICSPWGNSFITSLILHFPLTYKFLRRLKHA